MELRVALKNFAVVESFRAQLSIIGAQTDNGWTQPDTERICYLKDFSFFCWSDNMSSVNVPDSNNSINHQRTFQFTASSHQYKKKLNPLCRNQ